MPSFLSDGALTDLGKLVLLDHLLTGERLANYVGHLGPGDRVTAKALLDNQRSQLRQKVILHLETVYGIRERDEFGSLAPGNTLERAHQFLTLRAGARLQPPAAANLKGALVNLLDQGLRQQFPAHPVFEEGADLRPATLRRVLEVIERAAGAPGGRVEVERDLRKPMRQVVGPLLLGEMHEVPFLLGDHWKNHFLRREAQNGTLLRVRDARAAVDEPQPWGLPRELADLTGAAINANFITGIGNAEALALSGTTLYVADYNNMVVKEFDAITGTQLPTTIDPGAQPCLLAFVVVPKPSTWTMLGLGVLGLGVLGLGVVTLRRSRAACA